MPNRKNVLITGASSGLGRGMAKIFAAKGYNLALCARRMDRLEELKADLLTAYPTVNVWIKPLDVCQYDTVFTVFREFRDEMGSLDRVLVNAGMGKGCLLYTSPSPRD